MNANGLRFWLLADRKDWFIDPAQADQNVVYDEASRRLRLASELTALPEPPAGPDAALARLELPADALDAYGARAFGDRGLIRVTSKLPAAFDLAELPAAAVLSDLAMGYDGALYAAVDDGVVLVDTRDRWEPVRVRLAGFAAWRLAPDPSGGAWVLDRANRQLGRVLGLPVANQVYREYSPEVARPPHDDLDPPRIERIERAVLPRAKRSPLSRAARRAFRRCSAGRTRRPMPTPAYASSIHRRARSAARSSCGAPAIPTAWPGSARARLRCCRSTRRARRSCTTWVSP